MIIAKRWLFGLFCGAVALPTLGSPGYATDATAFVFISSSKPGVEAGVADDPGSAYPPQWVTQARVQGGSGLASNPRDRKAGSATCTPATTALCAAFETGCGFVGGGMSSTPDGGVTCSVSKTKTLGFVRRQAAEAKRLSARSGSGSARSEVATCQSDGSDDGNAICSGFGSACNKLGCGPSTEPDGGVTCSC